MEKQEFIERVAMRSNIDMNTVKRVLNTSFGVIGEAVRDKTPVVFQDFGRFFVKRVPLKKSINPATKEKITVPEHDKISFKAYHNIVKYSERYNV